MTKTTNYMTKHNTHNTFSGVLYASDFCTDYEGTRNIADRIARDWAFDKQCMKNLECRDRRKGE